MDQEQETARAACRGAEGSWRRAAVRPVLLLQLVTTNFASQSTRPFVGAPAFHEGGQEHFGRGMGQGQGMGRGQNRLEESVSAANVGSSLTACGFILSWFAIVTAVLNRMIKKKEDSMKKKANVNTSVCVACGACMKACPRGAISVWRGCHAAVEEAKCVGCGLCAKTCPAACIALEERSEVK